MFKYLVYSIIQGAPDDLSKELVAGFKSEDDAVMFVESKKNSVLEYIVKKSEV